MFHEIRYEGFKFWVFFFLKVSLLSILKKLIIIIDVMIFTSEKKKPELCYICEREMLQSNFFSKNKNFRNALLEYIPAIVDLSR